MFQNFFEVWCCYSSNLGSCYLQIVIFRLFFGFTKFIKNTLFLAIKQFFIFCENLKLLFEFFFVKTHKTPWPLWRGGIFFPLHTRDFGCSVVTESTWIAFRIFYGAPFSVVLRDFARNRGLTITQKSRYASCFWHFLWNYCSKMNGPCRFLLTLNFNCVQCSVVSQVALIKKLLMFNFEKIEVKITFLRACLLFLKIFS